MDLTYKSFNSWTQFTEPKQQITGERGASTRATEFLETRQWVGILCDSITELVPFMVSYLQTNNYI